MHDLSMLHVNSRRMLGNGVLITIDGDCVHIYYLQSFTAKAEALELFSVEKQLISSHRGTINL